jgi:hypothetical protein
VFGKYNDNQADSLFEIGNGTDDNNRSNALKLSRSGLDIDGYIQSNTQGMLDFSRTGVYNGIMGGEGSLSAITYDMEVSVDNSFSLQKTKGVMFRVVHANMFYWPSGHNVTLSINRGTAIPVYIGGTRATTDNFKPEKDVTYFAELANENNGDTPNYKWYLSMAILPSELKSMRNELEEVDDALFSDDTTTVDYADVITIANAPDVHAQSLKVKFAPIQAGSGDPSPSNVRPISGHTGASATIYTGDNMLDPTTEVQNYHINENGVPTSDTLSKYSALIAVESGNYIMGMYVTVTTSGNKRIHGYDANGNWVRQLAVATAPHSAQRVTLPFTVTSDIAFIRLSHQKNDVNVQIEKGTTAHNYVAYKGKTYSVQLGDTCYYGEYDYATGEFTSTHAKKTITGSESNVTYDTYQNPLRATLTNLITNYKRQTENNAICDRFVPVDNSTSGAILADDDNAFNFGATSGVEIRFNLTGIGLADANAFQSYLQAQYANGTPVEVVYELATPIRIQLTPQLIKLFRGYNIIYADAGQVRLEYTANLITCLNEDIAKKADNSSLGYVENGNTASRAYSANDIIVWQGSLVKATTSIASGAAFTLGTNVVSTSLGELITALLNS